MSRFAEIKKNRRKDEEDKKKSSSSTPKTNITGKQLNDKKTTFFEDTINKSKKTDSQTISRFDRVRADKAKSAIGIDTFQSDLISLSKAIGSAYDGWQTQETLANTRSSIESMQRRVNAYQTYQKVYGGTDLSELRASYKSALDGWEDLSKHYGQYNNADSYTRETTRLGELGAMTSSDVEKAWADATDGIEKLGLEDKLKTAKEYEQNLKKLIGKAGSIRTPSAVKPYSEAVKNATEERDNYLKSIGFDSIEAIENALSGKTVAYTTVGGENITWQSLYDTKKQKEESDALYKEISSSEDFEEYRAKGANTENPSWDEADGKLFGKKDVGNVVEYANANKDMLSLSNAYASFGDDRIYYTVMTNQERDLYNYHLGREQAGLVEEGTADKYIDSIRSILEDRYNNKFLENLTSYTDEHPVIASEISVWQNLGAGGEWLADSAKYITGISEELDENQLAKASSAIRSTVSQKVDWEIGNWDAFDFVYNTGMSMADSVTSMALFGGGGGVALGLSAAAQGTNDALARGLDSKQAFWSGLSAGVFEGLFESVSIGKFKALKDAPVDSVKTIIKNVGKSMLTNASEETLTEVANILYDNIANGDLSQAKTKIRAYMSAGMSEKDAIRKVAIEQGLQIAEAGASGALMGLGFGVMGGTSAYKKSKQMGQNIKANERVGEMFDIASNPEIASAYEAYTNYANKGINADNITDAQLGSLYTSAKAEAMQTINSKKSTKEQRAQAAGTLIRLGVVDSENTAKKAAKKTAKNFKVGEKSEININDVKLEGDKFTVATKDGKISVNETAISKTEAELLGFAKEYAKTEGEALANAFIAQYDGETDVEVYANSFNRTMEYAKGNFTFDYILNNKGELSAQAVKEIYKTTRIEADKKKKAEYQKLVKQMADKKFYKGFVDDSAIDYDNTSAEGKVNWNDLTSKQRNAVIFIKGFAQATGMNVEFVANNPVFNGSYNRDTNVLSINLDNMNDTTAEHIVDAVIPAMSHETTHWMRKKSPELWRHLNDIVFSTLVDHYNSDTEQALKDKADLLNVLGINYSEDTLASHNITEFDLVNKEYLRLVAKNKKQGKAINKEALMDEAREEIIARASEDLLKMSERGRKIFKSLSESEQKTLFEKTKAIIKDLLEWVNNALNSYEATSTEARIMREYKEQLQKASKVWDAMLEDSVKVNQALEKSGAYGNVNNELVNIGLQLDAQSDSIAPTTLLSEKTWTESEYVQNRAVAINAIVKALDVSEKEAERYVDNINSIARLIADDRARLDYEPNIDEHTSALKTNKEYKWTVDMSTLCAKRLLFTGTFDAIQKRLPNTIFNSEDIVSLRSMMMERDYEVACGICYVESTRRELGPITAEFIERYKLAQKNGTPISKINSAGKEVILQEKGTKRNFYAEDGYVPTLAELNTTDIDLVKRDHPEVYAAYLSFMKSRGQAIPKLLETRTEYKGEILKHFNTNSSVKARNDAGGLRVQSFSDFEVAHLIDMMQIVLDMSRVGLMSQAYTKVPAFADVFGNTGIKINLSLIAKDSGLDKNGNLIFDDVEGMPHKEAFRLRDKYSKNVGTILVGKNDAHIRAALADSRIDFVIPFHKSFWKESLYESLGLEGYEDYTETQNEKPFDKERKIKNFQPSEYWDYSKSGEENAKTYLKMCAEDGRIPKFPQFQNCEGYWKLLIDFKMYDNDGLGSPQMTVKPDFSMDEANAIMNSYEGGHREFPVAQDVVDDFVKKYEGRNDILYSDKVTEITEDDYKNMKNHFGVTGDFRVAGYMLKSGHMLDFSGKHWGDKTSTFRQVDHRDIQEVLPDENNGVDSMVNMISNGNIRLMPEVGGINLAVAPSKNQRAVLRRYIEYMSPKEGIIVDIDKVGGDTIKSFTYNKGTSADKIIRDIDNYFKGGTQSELMRFHTAEGDGVLYSEKKFSYDELISRDDLEGFVIDKTKQVKLSKDGKIDAPWVVNEVKKKCKVLKTNSNTNAYYTEVPDIDRNVEISYKGITHGFMKSLLKKTKVSSDRDILNARVSLEIPHILRNSIEVNRSSREGNLDIPYAHIMIGTVGLEDTNGNVEYYAVRSVIEERVNQNPILAEAEVLGKLHGINAKKIGTPHARVTNNGVALTSSDAYTYNVAQFLEDVKTEFDDTFSEDVYKNLGMTRKVNDFSKDLLFSEKSDTSVYDIMGENERLKKENEKFKADVERLKERLKIERQITHGNYFNENQLGAVAGHLRNIAKSSYDKVTLMKNLKDVYSFIAQSTELTWEEVFEKCYRVAHAMLEESKPITMSDDYSKMILHDIRNTKISLSESQKAEAQYIFGKHWNRNFFNRVTITDKGVPIDSQWQEWAELYPDIFSTDISDADMIGELYDIIGTLKDASEMLVEYDEEEQTRWLATEIYNQYWNVSNIKTTADKFDKKIKLLNFEHRKAMAEFRSGYEDRVEKQRLVDDMYYRRKMSEQKGKFNAELVAQRKAQQERYQKLYKDLRERKDNQIAIAKQHGRDMMDKYKDNAERKTRIQSITANAMTLKEMLVKNSKDKHIPEVMKGPVKALIDAIDFSSKRLLEKGVPTQKDISLQNALRQVSDMVVANNSALDGVTDLYGAGLDAEIKEMMKSVDRMANELNGRDFVLQLMTAEDLKTLDKMVKVIKASANKLNKFHVAQYNAGVEALGVATAKDVDDAKKIYKDHKKHFDKLKTKTYWNNLNPYYAFKNLGPHAMKIMQAFMDGQDKVAFLAKEVIDEAKKIYSDKEYKKWSKTFFDFKVKQPNGKVSEFSMNVPQIMSLYCVSKQEDARRHLLYGLEEGENKGRGRGITLVETDKTEAVRTNIQLTEADLNNIIAKLDEVDRAKEVADKLQEYMATRGAELGNEISMARWGIKSFGIENYFPIKVSDGRTPKKGETPGVKGNPLIALLNMSFTHARNQYASQSIEIGDVFDVFSNHMSSMIQYNAMALPVLDMYKWMNCYVESDFGEEISVETSIKDTFGDYAWGYFNTFLEDVNGSTKNDTRDSLGTKFFKNAKVAKVAANIRVAFLQFTSYIRAGAVMDNKYLLKAIFHEPKIQKSMDYCGIALWKSLGYYETDITRPLTDKIKHAEDLKSKVIDLTLKGAEYADKITWGWLWNACELEVRDTRKDLKVGSEEFNKEVGLRLREVVYRTQVVDSPLTRSQMMRSKSGWDKMLTTFASESTLSFNLITDLYVSYKLDARRMGKDVAKEKHQKYIRKAITAYVVTNVVTTLLASAFDAFRDYDEDDKDEEYITKLLLENFATNTSFINKIPYMNLLISIISGFSASRVETDWMESAVKGVKELVKYIAGEGSGEKAFNHLLKAASDATGIAGYNIYRDVMALYNLFD